MKFLDKSYYFFLVLSVVLYVFAPDNYSYAFCVAQMCLFVLIALCLFYQDRRSETIGFNLLFTMSFWGVNYIYPVFIYPVKPNYEFFARFIIDYHIISKATALATIAYAAYALGYSQDFMRKDVGQGQKYITFKPLFTTLQIRLIALCELILLLGLLQVGYVERTMALYHEYAVSVSPYLDYAYVLFFSFTLFTCVANVGIDDIFTYIILCVVIGVFLYTGSRALPLALVSIWFCYFPNRFKLSYWKMAGIMVIPIVAFYIVGAIRMGGTVDDTRFARYGDVVGVFMYATDFIVNNRNLYAIYSYVQDNPLTYGLSFTACLLSPIPLLQSTAARLLDIPTYMMRSETMTTYWVFGDHPQCGLGSNIVGDVYLAFGFMGVLLLFYILGDLIVSLRKWTREGNRYATVAYLVLVSDAIFMCRSMYLHSLRDVAWGMMFAFVFCKIPNITIKRKNS